MFDFTMTEKSKRKGNTVVDSDDGSLSAADSEIDILKRKLQLKTDALLMLSQELDRCKMQRDRLKLVIEQLQGRLDCLTKDTDDAKRFNGYVNFSGTSDYGSHLDFESFADNCTDLTDWLMEAREQNKCLRLQVDTLRLKLNDAQEDIKVLRSRKSPDVRPSNDSMLPAMHQRDEMIEQMEKLNVKCSQLRADMKIMLDEKQELVIERDAFKCKAHRLNHELCAALNAPKPIDIDSLINENKYLHERIQQLVEEKELAQQSLSKYKGMLDNRRQKETIHLNTKSGIGAVMTHKQVEELLSRGMKLPSQKSSQKTSNSDTELHRVCVALLESLNDKTLALTHQKKANKILAARICELDKSVQSPSKQLLEGYSCVDVDSKSGDQSSVESDLSEERSLSGGKDPDPLLTRSFVFEEDSEESYTQETSIPDISHMSLPDNLKILVEKALIELNERSKNIT